MTKDEALTLALEALEACIDYIAPYTHHIQGEDDADTAEEAITAIKEALAQPEQDDRRLQIAMRQWEDWKAYALESQKKLVKYEGGSPMILNTQPQEKNT